MLINVAHAGVISDAPSLTTIGMKILSFLLSVASIIAIIALVVSGLLYFFAFGDIKKMQLAKKSAKFAVLGIILGMAGMVIIKTAGSLLN